MAGETRRLDQRFQFADQRFSIGRTQTRTIPDMVQQASLIVESEQERADDFAFGGVAKASDNAIRSAGAFSSFHAGPLARFIRAIEAFCDNTVQVTSHGFEPSFRER